jgi:hypothetical protein
MNDETLIGWLIVAWAIASALFMLDILYWSL